MVTPSPHRCTWTGVVATALAGLLASPALNAILQRPPVVVTAEVSAFRRGRLVDNLTPGDLTLTVNGRSRPVRGLVFVRAAGGTSPDVPPPFQTNLPSSAGRTLLFVLDLAAMRAGQETLFREAVRDLVRSLGPRDRVGLAILPVDGLVLDFSTDHDRFLSRINSLMGQGSQRESASEFSCRSRQSLEAFRTLLGLLSRGEGPTAVAYIASGLSGPTRDAPATQFPGQCEIRPLLFQDIGTAARRARVRLSVIEPGDGTAGAPGRDGLEHLAGTARGRVITLPSVGPQGLRSLADEIAGYYRLMFEADKDELPGALLRVALRSTLSGVTLEINADVVVPTIVSGGGNVPASPREWLRTADIARDLPLRADSFVSRAATGDEVVLTVLAEPLNAGDRIVSAAVAAFDRDGHLAGEWVSRDTGDARPLRIPITLPVSPARVRLAAADHAGRSGTVDLIVDGVLPSSAGWRTSSLVLGLSLQGHFEPRLAFTGEPVAISLVEVYSPASGSFGVTFELARTLDGPALVTVQGTRTPTSDPGRYLSTGALPIGGFPPALFVVRATISTDDGAVVRLVRSLLKHAP